MATITLLGGKVELTLGWSETNRVESALEREVCPSCGSPYCCFSCDGSQGSDENSAYDEEDVADRLKFNGGLDTLEGILLAAACEGLIAESEDPKWNRIIETVLDAMGNNV